MKRNIQKEILRFIHTTIMCDEPQIWQLDCDVNNYDSFYWVDGADVDFIQSFDGRTHKTTVFGKRVEFYKKLPIGNIVGLASNIPIFDEKAWSVLEDLIKDEVELLRIELTGKIYYAINVLNVLDCIDYDRSEYKTFRDGKRIMAFTKYSFRQDIVKGYNIFKITDEPMRCPFVSDVFRKRVKDSNLKGFAFKRID